MSNTKMSNTKKWLVTVHGYDEGWPIKHPTITVSKVIELPSKETPIDWFLKGPTIMFKYKFKATALLNFWEIPNK